MHFTPALVLSTLAIGQAAAASNKHASFHARRQDQVDKRSYLDVDYVAVAKSLGDDFWKTLDYSGGKKAAATSAPVATPSPVVSAAEVKVEAKVTSAAAAAYATPTAAASAKSSSKEESIVDSVTDVAADLGSLLGSSGILPGLNSKTQSAPIWIGTDSKWKAVFTNKNSKSGVVVCWAMKGYNGMSVAVTQAEITVALAPGKSTTISFKEQQSGACSWYQSDVKLIDSMMANTWFEFTFGYGGVYQISKEANMSGNKFSAMGKNTQCLSAENSCIFECLKGMNRCKEGSDYDLLHREATKNCGGGYNVAAQGTGGGCHMYVDGDTIDISIA